MKNVSGWLGATALAVVCHPAAALDLTATMARDMHSVSASQRIAPSVSVGGEWYRSDRYRSSTNAYRGFVAYRPPLPLLDVTLSTRYQYLDTGFGSGGNLGFGASAYVPAVLPRVSVGGHLHYYPEALSHGDVDGGYEYGVSTRLRLVSNTYVTGGYRYFASDFRGPGKRRLDSGWVLGVQAGF